MSELLLNDPQAVSFWDQMDEAAKAGRSGGTVLQVELAFCWKVFTKKDEGFTQEQTFFPYTVGDKAGLAEAKKKANKFVVDNGLSKNPFNCFMIRLYKDSVLNRELTWEEDRFFFLFPSSYAYTDLVAPALRETGIQKLGIYWAAITWDQDKGGKSRMVQKTDADNNPMVDENGDPVMEERFPLVAYPVKIFASREEAAEFCGVDADAEPEKATAAAPVGKLPPMPEDYDQETWAATVAEIRSALGRGEKAPKLANDYGLPIGTIQAIKNL